MMNSVPLVTKILYPLETSVSTGMFLRDTGGCLLSKLAVSRSHDETREVSFAELSESAIFYFSIIPLAALVSKLLGAGLKSGKEFLSQNVSNINIKDQNLLNKIKTAKLGKIGLAFSILLPAIYAIAPLRNILTYSINGKDKFINVIELENKEKHQKSQEAKQKAKNLLKKLAGYSCLGIASTIGLMALNSLQATRDKIKPLTNFLLKHLDFKGNNGLTLKQLGFLVMPISVKSYFDASRDKYEVLENARRFAITIPMMFFGQDFIEKHIYKLCDKIFKSSLSSGKSIVSYDEIFKMSLKDRLVNLKAKNWAIAAAFLINTMGIAFAVAILNRLSTKRIYQADYKNAPVHYQNSVNLWLNTIMTTASQTK